MYRTSAWQYLIKTYNVCDCFYVVLLNTCDCLMYMFGLVWLLTHIFITLQNSSCACNSLVVLDCWLSNAYMYIYLFFIFYNSMVINQSIGFFFISHLNNYIVSTWHLKTITNTVSCFKKFKFKRLLQRVQK